MEAEPITPQPRIIPDKSTAAPAEIQALLMELHLPAARKARQMEVTASRIRAAGILMVIISFLCVCILLDSTRGDAGKSAAILAGASGIMTGCLALAFGAYMRGCAHHHRFMAVSAIVQSPHLTPAQARHLLARIEQSLPAGEG